MNNFSAIISIQCERLQLQSQELTLDFSIDSSIEQLTYDEIENKIADMVDSIFCFEEDDYTIDKSPYEIESIVIHDDDESYPVISENDDPQSIADEYGVDKVLVLPFATYTLTPEAKLWMKFKKMGLISEDSAFDYEKYHSLVEKGINA